MTKKDLKILKAKKDLEHLDLKLKKLKKIADQEKLKYLYKKFKTLKKFYYDEN